MGYAQHILAAVLLFPLTFASASELIEAARTADGAAIDRLLGEDADATLADDSGTTALHWAAHVDDLNIAKRLIDAGADINAVNRYRVTPLTEACTNGSDQMIDYLLRAGVDANSRPEGADPPLMIAARTGKPDAIKVLLENGARVNDTENSRKQTALMWAAAEGHERTVQLLLDAGAKLDQRSNAGFTAMTFAVREGKIDVVRTLLKAGVAPDDYIPPKARGGGWDKKNVTGAGPSLLALAALNQHYDIGAVLLDAGADPNFMWQGRTVMHEMVWVRKPGVGSNAPSRPGSGKMKSLEFIRLLVKHEATVDMRMKHNARGTRSYLNTTGATPFLLAACTADAELMTLLHDLGADPKLTNNEGTTALMMAAGVGVRSPTEDAGTEEAAREAVLLALKLGNDINAKDTRGETAMHGAAYKHFPSMPQLLVENGADIKTWNTKNKNGWTPLRIATGVERTANFRFCLKTAAAIKAIMEAAGVSTEL